MPSGVPLIPCQRWKADTEGPPEGPPNAREEEEAPEQTQGEKARAHLWETLGPEANPDAVKRVLEHGNRVIEMEEEELKRLKVGGRV